MDIQSELGLVLGLGKWVIFSSKVLKSSDQMDLGPGQVTVFLARGGGGGGEGNLLGFRGALIF